MMDLETREAMVVATRSILDYARTMEEDRGYFAWRSLESRRPMNARAYAELAWINDANHRDARATVTELLDSLGAS